MNKLEKIGAYELETGEEVTENMLRSIVKEEHISNVLRVFRLIENGHFESLTLEDIKVALSVKKIESKIFLDFKKNKRDFFICSDNLDLFRTLNVNTTKVVLCAQQMITHDNTLVSRNGVPISDYKALCEYLGLSYSTFRKHACPEIEKNNIFKKECIRGKSYLVLNPFFSTKNRIINEYVFKCFYREFKEYLHPLEYLYLVKLHGIDPSKVYIGTKLENYALLP